MAVDKNCWAITGGCGFIGSNLVRLLLDERPELKIVNVDALTYAGNPANLADVAEDETGRYTFVHADIADADAMRRMFEAHRPAVLLHLAAESHVDRSLTDATSFVRTNVVGSQVLLAAALELGLERFVMVSTDEVYGSLGPTGLFSETTPLNPHSPYSASKAGADLIAQAYHDSFGLDVVITRCSNNYGPYQFPEKLIPLMIKNALNDEPLPVYGDGMNVRDWIHVEDHARGILAVAERGRKGEVYNIGASNEHPNIEIVKTILRILDKPESLIRYVEDRKGHDRRYGIDSTKIQGELGWAPRIEWEQGLRDTIQWYINHRPWWEAILSGEYMTFYEKYYGERLKNAKERIG